jgi:superfamily I DNA/RNA helicase
MTCLRSLLDDAIARGESVAVLCRTNQVADMVRDALGERVNDAARLPDDWAKCRRLLAFIVNPHNDWLAALAAESIGLGQAAHLRRRAAERGEPVWADAGMAFRPDLNWLALHVSQESVMRVREKLCPDRIISAEWLVRLDEADAPQDNSIVMTIHKAKGREFDSVFIPCCDDAQYGGKDLEELRRLMFVAVTRARRNVTLSWSTERPSYGGRHVQVEPTCMIKEMGL